MKVWNVLAVILSESLEALSTNLEKFFGFTASFWQEGMLIDFIQKKSADKVSIGFLVATAYLFSERLVFERVVRVFLDLFVMATIRFSVFDIASAGSVLFFVLFLFLACFLVLWVILVAAVLF